MSSSYVYLLAVWVHILTVAVWIGAMFFADPQSDRFFSKLFERKLHGVGWYAQTVLWTTGIYLLHYRGIGLGDLFSSDFLATTQGKAIWAKIAVVLTMLVFQVFVGNRPSKLLYGYILLAFLATGLGVVIVRPGAML